MIGLQTYINNLPKTELEEHFYCEFVLDKSLRFSVFKINESHGSYIGQKELLIDLSKEIWKHLKNGNKENTFTLYEEDLDDYENIFFDTLTIEITDSGNTGYIAKKSKYNEKGHFFNLVYIQINRNECNSYDEILRILMHEMLHAYNHYQSFEKKSKNNLIDLIQSGTSYNKTLQGITTGLTPDNICKRIINNIRKLEQNAYINELTTELDSKHFDLSKYHNTVDAYKDAVKIFKSSDVWTQYSVFYKYVSDILPKLSDNYKQEFVSTYNDISDTNYTFEKMQKRIIAQLNKIFKKMETVIPKIFYDYYTKDLNEGLIRDSRAMVEFIAFENSDFNLNKGIWK